MMALVYRAQVWWHWYTGLRFGGTGIQGSGLGHHPGLMPRCSATHLERGLAMHGMGWVGMGSHTH